MAKRNLTLPGASTKSPPPPPPPFAAQSAPATPGRGEQSTGGSTQGSAEGAALSELAPSRRGPRQRRYTWAGNLNLRGFKSGPNDISGVGEQPRRPAPRAAAPQRGGPVPPNGPPPSDGAPPRKSPSPDKLEAPDRGNKVSPVQDRLEEARALARTLEAQVNADSPGQLRNGVAGPSTSLESQSSLDDLVEAAVGGSPPRIDHSLRRSRRPSREVTGLDAVLEATAEAPLDAPLPKALPKALPAIRTGGERSPPR